MGLILDKQVYCFLLWCLISCVSIDDNDTTKKEIMRNQTTIWPEIHFNLLQYTCTEMAYGKENSLSAFIEGCKQFVDGLCVNFHHGSSSRRSIANFRQCSYSICHNLKKKNEKVCLHVLDLQSAITGIAAVNWMIFFEESKTPQIRMKTGSDFVLL